MEKTMRLQLMMGVQRFLLLAAVVGGLGLFKSSVSAQYVSNWATTVQPVGADVHVSCLVNNISPYVPQMRFDWQDANNAGPAQQPNAAWFQARMFCYTNAAHNGDAVLVYSDLTTNQSNPIIGLNCPSDHPYWHKPQVKITSWGYSNYTYP
jgi:hypothetical protein